MTLDVYRGRKTTMQQQQQQQQLTLRVARVTVRCRLISNQRQEITVFY